MSERDQIRGRARKAFPRKYPDADAVVDAMTDFAASERDRAWNDALDAASRYCDERTHEMDEVEAGEVWVIASEKIRALKRPQPPAQQDDKPEATAPVAQRAMSTEVVDSGVAGSSPAGSQPPALSDDVIDRIGAAYNQGVKDGMTAQRDDNERERQNKPEAVKAPRGETPARESSPSPAPFDIERRARELEITPDGLSCGTYLHVEPWMSSFVAIALAREAQQAKAEEIAQDCEKVLDQDYRGGPRLLCAGLDAAVTIARSHAIPPQPAPETREERYRKALEMILKEPALGISQARFAAREALGGGA